MDNPAAWTNIETAMSEISATKGSRSLHTPQRHEARQTDAQHDSIGYKRWAHIETEFGDRPV